MAAIRLSELTLAQRGMFLTCLLLIAQYPGEMHPSDAVDPPRPCSWPMSTYQISKLAGSHPKTVKSLLDDLEVAGLIRYTSYDVLELVAPFARLVD